MERRYVLVARGSQGENPRPSFFLNRKPWGKAPRQNATILKEKGNKYLRQAQPEVRQTEKRENRPKGQKSQQSKAKQTITRLEARARWKDEDLL
jgi:hypothetical protein